MHLFTMRNTSVCQNRNHYWERVVSVENTKKAVNEIPGITHPWPHPCWKSCAHRVAGMAASVGVYGAGCSPGLIHQLLKHKESPPWWCSHAMGRTGGSLLAKVLQERLYGLQGQA